MKNIEHLNIEVTNNCNQNCFYCFNNSGSDSNQEFLPATKWLNILNSLKSKGLKSVHYTGGEPFIYPEIIKLIKGSLDIGLSTSVLSNGYKLKYYSSKYPKILSKLTVAQISLDSVNPEIHNKRRKNNNAWHDANDAILALVNLNVPVEISSTIDDENIQSISGLAEFAVKNSLKLIIRPMLNIGRAKKLSYDTDLAIKIKNEIASIKKNVRVNLVDDRFNYLSYNEIEKEYFNQNTLINSINNNNFRYRLSEYLNKVALL